jgi:multiple sugar transport system substrate-binding protein
MRVLPLFFIALFALTGCLIDHDRRDPEKSDRSSDPNAHPRIILFFAAYEDEHSVYRPLIAQFERDNPQIEIRLVSLDRLPEASAQQDGNRTLTPLQHAVQHADVLPTSVVGAERLSPLLLNLKPYVEADAQFDAADFYPGVIERAMLGETMWMVPSSFRIPLLSYNKELLAQTGVAPPGPDWTWQDVLTIAEQVALPGAEERVQYGLLDPSSGVLTLNSILQARGSELGLRSIQNIQLERPEVAAAVDELQRLKEVNAILLPGYLAQQTQKPVDVQQLVLDNRIALWPEDAVVTPDDRSTQRFDNIAFPAGYNPLAGQVDYGYSISAGTSHPQEAWQWVAFLSRQDLTGLSSVAPNHIPARRSLVEQNKALQRLPPETVAAYELAIGRPEYATTQYTDVDPVALEAVQKGLDAVFTKKQKPAQALREAQQALDAQRALAQAATPTDAQIVPVPVATPQPRPATDATTITFMTRSGIPDFVRLSERFQEQFPGIAVNIVSTNVLTEAPSLQTLAQSSDCFVSRYAAADRASDQLVLDLQPLLDADASLPLDDYPQALLSLYQRDQRLMGLPYAFRVHPLTYNATLFQDAGLTPPEIMWTPDDFLAAAAALSQGEGDQRTYGYAPFLDPGYDLLFFIRQFGGQVALGSGTDARPNFTDATVMNAIRWYLDLSEVHRVAPKPTFAYKYDQYFSTEARELAQSGRVGMWFAWGTQQFEPDGFAVSDAPLPLHNGALAHSDVRMQGLHISAQTQNAQACWEWITFVSQHITNSTTDIPARTSVAQSEAFQQQALTQTLELYQIYQPLIEQARPANDVESLLLIDSYWFYAALTSVVEEGADLTSSLEQAQVKTTAFMECISGQETATICALKVDPNYQGYNLDLPDVPGAG